MPTYEQDFYAWTQEQARMLRAGALAHLDIPNLVEEIESMGRSEKRELVHEGASNPMVVMLSASEASRAATQMLHCVQHDNTTGSFRPTCTSQPTHCVVGAFAQVAAPA
jgi:hypothetical protein